MGIASTILNATDVTVRYGNRAILDEATPAMPTAKA